ncbi:helix-turn-helix domain-containing protein [Gorillibacterium sp. sgz5001074]|uniref:helix-turn-helix domain-containing protein n=1 Tax=Gorillibacterium sp. sgz5001074 TaxID=3446695 RepID=UPI003F664D92
MTENERYMNPVFGERMRKLRESRGWLMDKAAAEYGVSRAMVSKYEDGAVPKVELLTRISDLYNVTTDYLLGRSNEAFLPESKQEETLSTEEALALKKFLMDTEAMLREAGSVDETKLSHVKQFMEFVFRKANEEEKKKK